MPGVNMDDELADDISAIADPQIVREQVMAARNATCRALHDATYWQAARSCGVPAVVAAALIVTRAATDAV